MSLRNCRPSPKTWLWAGLAAVGVAALLLTPDLLAQQPRDTDDVTINTIDGVELKGTFYKGRKGKDSPVALFLHAYGKDRTKGNWDKLAKDLVAKDFAVMSFDFRGHGGSTTVTPQNFWTMPQNAPGRHLSGNKNKTTISYKDFRASYLPYLVNDIAAVRHFLDKKNDAGACNTSNIFVVGDQEGAELGMLWIATEWQRDGTERKFGGAMPAQAGQDYAGAIWLSAKRVPANWNISKWYGPNLSAQARDKVPMCFFYGDLDAKGKDEADHYLKVVLKPPMNTPVNAQTFGYPIKGTSLTGIDLLGKPELKSDEYLAKYVDIVMSKRGGSAVWQQRGNIQEALVPIQSFGVGN
jgi:pimeloyl-ACP methyl ester carboxylesterase